MRGRYAFVLIIAAGAFALTANTSRRSAADGGSESGGETSNPPEPITNDSPAVPNEAPTSVPREPFSSYGIGDPGPDGGDPAWAYQQLSAAEQAQVDRGREPSEAAKWAAVHDAYKSAIVLRAAEAAAQAATIRLGIDNLQEGALP
jgi:hypothetical protein